MCSIQNILHLYSFKLNLATLIPPNTYNELKMEGYQKGGGCVTKQHVVTNDMSLVNTQGN